MPETTSTKPIITPLPADDALAGDVSQIVGDFFSKSVRLRHAPGRPHRVANMQPASPLPYGASVEIVGAGGCTVTVGFDADAATGVTKALLGIPADADSPECADALGEVANIIAGRLKCKLALAGDAEVKLGLPRRFDGEPQPGRAGGECVALPVKLDPGTMLVEVQPTAPQDAAVAA